MAHTDEHGAHGTHGAPKLNHETQDISLTGTTRAALLSLAVVGVVMLVVYGAWGFFLSQERAADPGIPPMAAPNFGSRVPSTPRLQSTPYPDLLQYRAAQQSRLTSYGWVDQGQGLVRIPIDQAMRLVVERASMYADETLAEPEPGPPAESPQAVPAAGLPAVPEVPGPGPQPTPPPATPPGGGH